MSSVVTISGNEPKPSLVEEFVAIYQQLNAQNLDLLDSVYRQDIRFIDPVHEVVGLEPVKHYMEKMYRNIDDYQLIIKEVVEKPNLAYMDWDMSFRHPKLNRGKVIQFSGVSKIKFAQTIYYHQDFYDLGSMLYEYIPLLGRVVKLVKSRAAQ
ncbi:MAG: nuclear transport factor 2 family protein [Gammaproteobacteria bacterium]|nr:nuclear transport factor 2 family protein [Gammaproteobacteria bacterium]NVK88905.1 nuclear transport factor 2 family protein [Gammaproteobacteria bacterium]